MNWKVLQATQPGISPQMRLLAGVILTLLWCAPLKSQDVIMQGFYWNTHPGDVTNTTTGGIWWDTLAQMAPQLAGAGFQTVWTPPPTKGFAGPWDMGYGPYDYFDLGEFNSKGATRTRHGSRAQLNAMITAMHNNGLKVMADIVLNHRGGGDAQAPYQVGGGTGYTVFTPPSGRMFGGPQHFHPNFYHPDQNPDYHNPLFFEDICYFNEGDAFPPTNTNGSAGSWFFGAPGITQIGTMGDSLIMWGRWLMNEVGFDEIRLDAVKHIEPDYLAKFIVETKTPNQPYTLGEFFDYNYGPLSYYHNAVESSGNSGTKQANMSLYDFPLRGALQSVLNNGSGSSDLYQILGGAGLVWGANFSGFDVVTWLDSHDTDRTGYIGDSDGCDIPYGGACLELHTENDHNPIFSDKEDMGYPFLMAAEGRPMVFWKDWYWYGLSKHIKWQMALRQATATGTSNHIQQMNGSWSTSAPFDGDNHGGNMFAMRRNGLTNGASDGMVLGLNDHPSKTNGVEVNTPFSNKYIKDYSDGFMFESSYAASTTKALIKAKPRDYSWYAPTGLYPTPPDAGASHFQMDATPGGCPHFIALRVADAANFLVNGDPIQNGDQIAVKNLAGEVVGIGRIGQGFAWDGQHDMIIEVLGAPATNGMADNEVFRIFVYDASLGTEKEVGSLEYAPAGQAFAFLPDRPQSPNRSGSVSATTNAAGAFDCNGISLLLGFDTDGCSIYAISAGEAGDCIPETNTFSQQVIVYYVNQPLSGQLVVNGINYPITGNPQTITLNGLPADGAPVDVNANFSADPGCAFSATGVFTAPPSCITFFDCGTSIASAAVYDNGWTSGDDDGDGFGAWTLSNSGPNTGYFVFTSTSNGDGNNNGDNDIDTGGRAWGMYANSGNVSNAVRPFDTPLTPGSTFAIDMDNGWIESGGTVGFGLRDALGNNRMEFYFRAGQANYKVNDNAGETDTGLGFTDEGLNIEFTLLTATTYELVVTRLTGGSYTHNGTLMNPGGGQPIAQVRLFNANAGFDSPRNAYFNSMEVCVPVDPCSITGITAGTQGECDEETNYYSQQVTVTFLNPPPVGQLAVNGQYFAIGTSPQTVTLTGLNSNGQPVDVTAFFSAVPTCTYTEEELFTAPPSCLPCDILSVSAGAQSACQNDTYSQQITVTYENPPTGGSLIVNGIQFAVLGSPQTVEVAGLVADGEPVNVSAAFSDAENCAYFAEALFTAPDPCPPCDIISVSTGAQTGCVAQTNSYTQALTVTYTIDNPSGFLVVNGQYYPITGSPQTIILAGLNADGNPVNVSVSYSADPDCAYYAEALFTAPAGCADEGQCQSDAAAAGVYNDGWTSGDNSGSGFAPWQLSTSGPNAGHFVYTSTQNGDGDSNSDGDIDTGGEAWGLYANSGNVSNAVRPFAQPMASGDLLNFRIDNGWIENGGTVGFGLQNATGQNLLEFYFAGGNPNYFVNDGSGAQTTAIGFTDEGLAVSFILINNTTYELYITRLSDNFSQVFSGPLMSGGGNQVPARIRFFNANAGFSAERNAYVNSLSLCRLCTEAPGISCDEITALLNPTTNMVTVNAVELAEADGCGPFTYLVNGLPSLTFDCDDLGPHQVVVTAEDANEQMAQCNATVIVAENVPPTVNCKPATVYLNSMGQATLLPGDVFLNGSDNCGTVTPLSVSPNTFACANIGSNNTVTLTVVDGYANTATCTATVTVADQIMPGITPPATATVYRGAGCSYDAAPSITGYPTVSDNCGTNLTPGYTDEIASGNCAGALVITRTWTVNDGNGNSVSAMQTINVVDQIAPAFNTAPSNSSAACGNHTALNLWLANRGGAIAVDNCSGVNWQTPQLISSTNGCGSTACYTYSFTAVDACQNSAGATATFCFTDNTPPTPLCRNSTVYVGSNGIYYLQNADVLDIEGSFDNCGSFQVTQIQPAGVSCAQVGTTIPVVVTVVDECGNPATCTAQVTVAENTGLPAPWQHGVVGSYTGTGTAGGCAGNNVFNLTANGFSTPTQDAHSAVYRTLCGNGSITARVANLSATGGFAGLFMRESLSPGAKKAVLRTQLNTLVHRDVRNATNGPTNTQQYPVPQGPQWLRITRNGNIFTFFTSFDGVLWNLRGTSSVTMPNCVLVGIFTESINVNTVTAAQFDNVSVIGNAALAVPDNTSTPQLPESSSEELSFDIFPNPTNGQVQLKWTGMIDKQATIRIFNSMGQQVLQREVSTTATEMLDLSALAPGIYLVQAQAEGGRPAARRVVVGG
ncbi:MAG: T9SS type A sorting domain-containing protein [Saprospiraceae bacterium]|nr:T9SS type A sorting domain-containing protein [Saprospiraceae bacterium]